MKILSASSVLLVLIGLSCASGPSRSSPVAAPDLQVTAEYDADGPDPFEGSLGRFIVRIRNISTRIIVLRDASLSGGPAILSWQVSPLRPLRYDPGRDEYRPEREAAAEVPGRPPAEPLNVGTLLPGEELRLLPQVRLLDMPRRYALTYHAFTPDEAARNLYFEEGSRADVRYRRRVATDIARFDPGVGPALSHRAVVFPHARSPLLPVQLANLVLDVRVVPRRFRLADALRRLNLPPEECLEKTCSDALAAWAIRTRDGAWLVSERGRVPLPRITPLETFFQHLDALDERTPVAFEILGGLDAVLPDVRMVEQRSGGRTRRFAFIYRADLEGFLRTLAERGLEVVMREDDRGLQPLIRRAR